MYRLQKLKVQEYFLAARGTQGRTRTRTHTRRSGEEGYALIAVIVAAAMLLSIGTVGVRSARIEINIAANDLHALKALAVAEAGLEHAAALIEADGDGFNDELEDGGTGGAVADIGATTTVTGASYRFHAFGGQRDTDGYYVRIVDNFDETSGVNDPDVDTDSAVKISSRGQVGSAVRIVEMVIRPAGGAFPAHFIAKTKITLSGGSWVDTYDSSQGPYDVATAGEDVMVRSNGDITLSGGETRVHGDATAGGEVSASGGAEVTGETVEGLSPDEELPSVDRCGPPFSDPGGISGEGSWAYDDSKGELKASGSGNIILAGGNYCFSNVTLSGASTLTISDPVLMYVTGKAVVSGGGLQNTSQIPSNFQLFSSSTRGVVLSGGSGSYGVVYAPDSKVDFSGGSDFYGAVIAQEIVNSGGTNMHGDAALVGGGDPARSQWREVRRF